MNVFTLSLLVKISGLWILNLYNTTIKESDVLETLEQTINDFIEYQINEINKDTPIKQSKWREFCFKLTKWFKQVGDEDRLEISNLFSILMNQIDLTQELKNFIRNLVIHMKYELVNVHYFKNKSKMLGTSLIAYNLL